MHELRFIRKRNIASTVSGSERREVSIHTSRMELPGKPRPPGWIAPSALENRRSCLGGLVSTRTYMFSGEGTVRLMNVLCLTYMPYYLVQHRLALSSCCFVAKSARNAKVRGRRDERSPQVRSVGKEDDPEPRPMMPWVHAVSAQARPNETTVILSDENFS
jgi:hypothetical protein